MNLELLDNFTEALGSRPHPHSAAVDYPRSPLDSYYSARDGHFHRCHDSFDLSRAERNETQIDTYQDWVTFWDLEPISAAVSPPSGSADSAFPSNSGVQDVQLVPNLQIASLETPPKTSSTKHSKSVSKTADKFPLSAKDRFYIDSVLDNDVIFGRRCYISKHIGNCKFREVIEEHKQDYQQTDSKKIKISIGRSIVEHVCSYGGRFVSRDDETGQFYILTKGEAFKKTTRALREKSSS